MKLLALWLRWSTRPILAAAALTIASASAFATWSIVVVNTKTGEVCVACATCLSGSITKAVPVLVPGVGAGACQSTLDLSAINKKKIWRGFHEGWTPSQILAGIQATDFNIETRQIGIVNLYDDPVTFTGSFAGLANPSLVGIHGDLRYAIQGNLLACDQVVLDAEQALIHTPGDLSQKVMAAMQAARAQGGDGRCSCSGSNPTMCGCVTSTAVKSAHTAFFMLARIGDGEGDCSAQLGCANGGYFLSLNVPGVTFDPLDPVANLQTQYDAWRASKAGVPDQAQSSLSYGADALVADGKSTTWVDFELRDIDGQPITGGALSFVAYSIGPNPAVTTASDVIDLGGGKYSIELQAGTQTGTDVWRIAVTDLISFTEIALQPDVAIRVDPLVDLHAGFDAVEASGGAAVPFTINLGAPLAGNFFILLGSASGTVPGTPFGSLTLPLNFDAFFRRSVQQANGPVFENTSASLDDDGRATPRLIAPAQMLLPLVGHRLDFAVAVLGPTQAVSGNAGFDVLP